MTGILDSLTLNFGPTPESEPLTIEPGAMTVLVGPNSSGKSLLLREVIYYVAHAGLQLQYESPRPPRRLFGLLSMNARPSWVFPGGYRIIKRIRPHLPDEKSMRSVLWKIVRVHLQDLMWPDEPQNDPLITLGLNVQFTLLQAHGRWDDIKKLQWAAATFQGAQRWYAAFLGLVKRRELDAVAFLQLCDIERTEPLGAWLLCDGIEIQSHDAFLERDTSEQNQLAVRFLQVASQFTKWLSDADDWMRLVTGGVIDLHHYWYALGTSAALLDGHSRLRQIEPQRLRSFYKDPDNDPSVLLRDRYALDELRERVYQTFGFHLAIDFLDMENARFVAAEEPPAGREFTVSREALEYFQAATPLADMSDGVKSFVGIHAALAGRDYQLILIDEPEAFLHPPLVRRLGFDLTRMAAERGASIVAATHSAHFLMGCIEAGHDVGVIRLGYEDQIATARALPASELTAMMRKPLLRSTGVLSALFHRAAVVCEGDSDGAFYGEINERLRVQAEGIAGLAPELPDGTWIRDAVFINAHSKASVPELMGALRRAGVPAAAIVDLDLLLDDEVLPDLLKNAGASERRYKGLGQTRRDFLELYNQLVHSDMSALPEDADAEDKRRFKEQFKRKRGKLIKRGGVANLPDAADQRALREFLGDLAAYGIFVPECGDLESWLPEISHDLGKGKHWLPTMFDRMGMLGTDDYIAPGQGDVWAFVRKVATWIDRSLKQYDWIPNTSQP